MTFCKVAKNEHSEEAYKDFAEMLWCFLAPFQEAQLFLTFSDVIVGMMLVGEEQAMKNKRAPPATVSLKECSESPTLDEAKYFFKASFFS